MPVREVTMSARFGLGEFAPPVADAGEGAAH